MGRGSVTWNDLVRKHIPEATDEECDLILWEMTEFPLVTPAEVEAQIIKVAQARKETVE